jgi:hypothetical protein
MRYLKIVVSIIFMSVLTLGIYAPVYAADVSEPHQEFESVEAEPFDPAEPYPDESQPLDDDGAAENYSNEETAEPD